LALVRVLEVTHGVELNVVVAIDEIVPRPVQPVRERAMMAKMKNRRRGNLMPEVPP